MVTCTRHSQVQANQNPSMDRVNDLQVYWQWTVAGERRLILFEDAVTDGCSLGPILMLTQAALAGLSGFIGEDMAVRREE